MGWGGGGKKGRIEKKGVYKNVATRHDQEQTRLGPPPDPLRARRVVACGRKNAAPATGRRGDKPREGDEQRVETLGDSGEGASGQS
ncbi:hypothetical protein AAFF_G00220780 [Aldrovandia affinis]|uniref:Uncharacterized protein n=1 Tax=Aldrovandia affinis TaxID=143900 RepID=A0AAD7RFJ7_9TELE|nr:hypothetical protein AAFF_G00220780 [Aldrovandia affinis]